MYDAIVIGGGPAGSASARLLAAWGHRVLLVDRPRPPNHSPSHQSAVESLPPSARQVVATIGALDVIDDPAVQPWLGNVVWWADAPRRVEQFPAGIAGQQLQRDWFDARLRGLAVGAGAECATALARDAAVPGLTGGVTDSPSVVLEAEGAIRRVTAPMILDASGRAGVIARQGLRLAAGSASGGEAPRTIALSAEWRTRRDWPGVDNGHTLIASYDGGWAWSIAPAPGVRHFTVMIDPARSGLMRNATAADVYRRELDRVAPFRALVAAGEIAGRPWGADATTYSAERFAGEGFLLVGDAATSLDPLSSFGVKKALASGWLAAVVAHTVLSEPRMAGDALAFFNRRERQMHAAGLGAAAAFASQALGRSSSPFWSVRAAEAGATDHLDEDDPRALARDADVLAAFDDLKRRQRLALRPGPALRIEARATVRGREVVLDEHLVVPAWPDGVRYLRGVDLLALIRLAPRYTDAGELFEAFLRAHPGVILPDAAGALAALIARGALVHGQG
ncbi:MAG TPA: FAD-dependent monooxygenase [Vicinamibacterales bacterium]|nr:FAD-dependent monooxygenase [Vicinamibacterales bacterium]